VRGGLRPPKAKKISLLSFKKESKTKKINASGLRPLEKLVGWALPTKKRETKESVG